MAWLALEVLGKPVAIVLLRGRLEKVPEHIYLSKWLDTFLCSGSRGVERRHLNILWCENAMRKAADFAAVCFIYLFYDSFGPFSL